MKQVLRNELMHTSLKLGALFILTLCPSLGHAASKTPQPTPVAALAAAPIDGVTAINLVRSTLMSLHDANISGNYTVLRDLGSPSFQRRSSGDLGKSFAPLRVRKLDLFRAASTIPVLTSPPAFGPDNRLHLKGAFKTRPEAVVFDFAFEQVNGEWRHSSLALGLEAAVSQ